MLKKWGIKDNVTSSAHFRCYLHKDSAVECLCKTDIVFFTHCSFLSLESFPIIFEKTERIWMVAVYAKTLVCCSGRTISLGGHHAVNSSHTSMLTTAWKPTSERILWIGVTFDYLSATRCVSIKDDVFYGSWSEWRICSYKHALQFSPRCEVERLSNHPFESTSQNEWTSRPMLHIRAAAMKKKAQRSSVSCLKTYATLPHPTQLPNYFFILSNSFCSIWTSETSFFFCCCFLLVHL